MEPKTNETMSNNHGKFNKALEKFMAKCDTLSKNEKRERLACLSVLYRAENYSLTTIALMALTIGGNTLGAEYFKKSIPLEVREAYYNSSYRLQTDEDPITMRFFQDMFIGDKLSVIDSTTQDHVRMSTKTCKN